MSNRFLLPDGSFQRRAHPNATHLPARPKQSTSGSLTYAGGPPTGGRAGLDVALVKIVRHGVQSSVGDWVNMAVNARRTLPLLSSR
jgi:hypothetical protein